MADDIDRANDNAQRELQHQLSHIAPAQRLPAVGACHFCNEPLDPGDRFCDTDCRDDYEYLQQRRRANQ